VPANSITYWV